MGAITSLIHPIDAFHSYHYHICGFIGSAKCPPGKQTGSLASGDIAYAWKLLDCSYKPMQLNGPSLDLNRLIKCLNGILIVIY